MLEGVQVPAETDFGYFGGGGLGPAAFASVGSGTFLFGYVW